MEKARPSRWGVAAAMVLVCTHTWADDVQSAAPTSVAPDSIEQLREDIRTLPVPQSQSELEQRTQDFRARIKALEDDIARRKDWAATIAELEKRSMAARDTEAKAQSLLCNAKAAKARVGGALQEFSAAFAGATTVVSADLFTGYSLISEDYGSVWPKAIGFRVATAIPASAGKLSEYGDTQLLLRDGALFTLYFSAAGSPFWYVDDEACQAVGFIRRYVPDRTYIDWQPIEPLLRAYVSHGVGIKAIKTGLKDDDATGEDASRLAAAGVVYVGLGINGPVWDANGDHGDSTGTLDLQATWSISRVNTRTLRHLYGVDADDDWVQSAGAKLDLFITDVMALSVEYSAPLDSARRFMDAVTLFSVKYTPKKD